MDTIGYYISRIRGVLKAVKIDAFLTDRQLYSIIKKNGDALLKREDERNRLMRTNIFQIVKYLELEDVSRVDGSCVSVPDWFTIKRTVDKVPKMLTGYWGQPLIRSITAISGSPINNKEESPLLLTTPEAYGNIVKSKNFKYNKTRYCWFEEQYLFTPNLPWDAIRLEAAFDQSVDRVCGDCSSRQDDPINIPTYLYMELDALIMRDFRITFSLPEDQNVDKQNPLR